MNERGRRFSHLSWHNRLKIDKMLKEGYKAQEIADALHVPIPPSIERSSAD